MNRMLLLVLAAVRTTWQACGNGGRWERAVALLHEMEEDGSTPQISAFEAALDTLKHAGQWEKASPVIASVLYRR